MKFVRRFLIVTLIFLIIAVLISLFLPSSLQLERKTIINADKSQIFSQINDLKNWKNWSPWALKDSTVHNLDENFTNPSSGVGATFKWDSENDEVGKGSMKIIESKKNQSINYVVDFGTDEIKSGFILSEIDDGVEVKWTMDVNFGFNPLSKFFGLFMEGYVGEDYELGLARLKEFSEDLPKINSVKVIKKVVDKMWFLSLRDTVNQQEMNNIHGSMYSLISSYMENEQLEIKEAPFVIYHFWSDSIIDIEAGIPVFDSINVTHERIKLNTIDSGNVITATHVGPYERLVETYDGINEWIRKNEVKVIGPPWEQYITDPSTESNPENWKTAIYFPVQ